MFLSSEPQRNITEINQQNLVPKKRSTGEERVDSRKENVFRSVGWKRNASTHASGSTIGNSAGKLRWSKIVQVKINYMFSDKSTSSSNQYADRFFNKQSRKQQHNILHSFEHRKRSKDHRWDFLSNEEKEHVPFAQKEEERFVIIFLVLIVFIRIWM